MIDASELRDRWEEARKVLPESWMLDLVREGLLKHAYALVSWTGEHATLDGPISAAAMREILAAVDVQVDVVDARDIARHVHAGVQRLDAVAYIRGLIPAPLGEAAARARAREVEAEGEAGGER